jgi:hypothetical protein
MLTNTARFFKSPSCMIRKNPQTVDFTLEICQFSLILILATYSSSTYLNLGLMIYLAGELDFDNMLLNNNADNMNRQIQL